VISLLELVHTFACGCIVVRVRFQLIKVMRVLVSLLTFSSITQLAI
jgi:hypothetical protein